MYKKKTYLRKLVVVFSVVLACGFSSALLSDPGKSKGKRVMRRTLRHLKKDSFDKIIKLMERGQKNCLVREWGYEDWSPNLPYVCWNSVERRLVIPPRISLDSPEPGNRRPSISAIAALDKKYSKWADKMTSKLLTSNQMVMYMLESLLNKPRERFFSFYNILRKVRHHPDDVRFFILDFAEAPNGKKKEVVHIHYCVEDEKGHFELMAVDSTNKSDYKTLQSRLGSEDEEAPEDIGFEVNISGMLEDTAIKDICRLNGLHGVVFHDSNSWRDSKPGYMVNYGGTLHFNLRDGSKFDKHFDNMTTKGVWLGNAYERRKRVSQGSILTHIMNWNLVKYRLLPKQKKGKKRRLTCLNVFSDGAFELILAKTANFEEGKEKFTDDIRENELPAIRDFIRGVSEEKERKLVLLITGYADNSGDRVNESQWKTKNRSLSFKRAARVKRWLHGELGGDNFEMLVQPCDERYYYYDDRSVEIQVILADPITEDADDAVKP
ncbi:MAG: hypothetical protein GY765_05345 [bacterium]|nr:hypothetical protein [bacterium]